MLINEQIEVGFCGPGFILLCILCHCINKMCIVHIIQVFMIDMSLPVFALLISMIWFTYVVYFAFICAH